MSVNGEIHDTYNLYIITNTVKIVTRGNFTKETNGSTEGTLKTAYHKSKDSCKT